MCTSGYFGRVTLSGPPAAAHAAAGLQAASGLMLRLTAAVMQPSLQKGASSTTRRLTHFAGKLLPSSQSRGSAGPGLDGCPGRGSPGARGQRDYRPQTYVYRFFPSVSLTITQFVEFRNKVLHQVSEKKNMNK